jgi:putative nucleotidyltransferase with HDIG domain
MCLAIDPPRGPTRALISPLRNIRWRIIAPYAVLTVVLAVAGTFLVTRLVGGSLDERFNNQLAEASRVASDALVRRERQHLEAVRAIAFTDGIGAATAAGDSATLERLVQPLAGNSALERVELLDASGRRIYGARLSDASTLAYAPLRDATERSSWASVQDVLAGRTDDTGDKFSEIVDTPNGPVLYTAGPVYDGNRIAGVVLVGTTLDTFVNAAKLESLADVTIYDADGAAIASTFAHEDEGIDLTRTAAAATDSGDAPLREHRTLFGRDFDLLYGTLYLRGEPVASYSVGLPSSFIFSAQQDTREQMTLLFTVGIAAALIVGWFIARSITGPVQKLVRAAHAVGQGDLSARADVRGLDEIGILGRAFDDMTEKLQNQLLSTVRALTSAIDARDPYTMGHSLRVGQLAMEIGKDMALPDQKLRHLEVGGYLHDIGKIGVRDNVLLKPGALTPEERKAIERHPQIGLDILAHVQLPPDVVEFVGSHHEKLNGTGYPHKLHAPQISIVARIAAVADIYDALVTDRPYRAGMTPEKALEILHKEQASGQLDLQVIEALERVVPLWEQRRRDEPELRGFRIETPPQETNGTAPPEEVKAA